MRILGTGLIALAFSVSASAELGSQHQIRIELDWNGGRTSSDLGAWIDGGHGKLRYDNQSLPGLNRLAIEYSGRIAPQLFAHAILDYIDDPGGKAGLTEAYLEWRPLPTSVNRHRFRFGAFYPGFSYENSGFAWESPYSRSFSTVNAWLGEEIRPIGVDWRLSRPLGGQGSPHEIGFFGGVFYGNDPAGTLLFWRGWSAHDRQTRLNERLPLPSLVSEDPDGGPDLIVPRTLDPIAEIDDKPGAYAGVEWRYARQAKISLGAYDNRADPNAFRDGQWAWGTRFWQLAAQFSLPGDVGLVLQSMRGDTDWLIGVRSDGTTSPFTRLVTDEFEASFILLTRTFGRRHRATLRWDNFDLYRPGQLEIDRGHAVAVTYSANINPRLEMQLEWLEIESVSDLLPRFYGKSSRDRSESLLQLGFRVLLFDSTQPN